MSSQIRVAGTVKGAESAARAKLTRKTVKNRRVFLLTLAFAVVIATSTLGYLLYSGFQEARRGAETTSSNLAALLESKFDDTFRRGEAVLTIMQSEIPPDAYLPDAKSSNRLSINATLDLLRTGFSETASISVFNANGDMIYYTGPVTNTKVNIADRDYFKQAKAAPGSATVFSEPLVSRSTGKPVVVLVQAVRDPDGRFLGAESVAIDLEYFQDLFSRLTVGSNGMIAVRRTDDYKLVMRWPEKPSEVNTAEPATAPARRMIERGTRAATIDVNDFTTQLPHILSMMALDHYPFYVLVAEAHRDVFTVWYERGLSIAAVGVVMMLALGYLLHRLRLSELHEEALGDELKGHEEELRLWGSVFQHSGEGIWVCDEQRRIVTVNEAFSRLTGYSLDDVQGRHPAVLSAGKNTEIEEQKIWTEVEKSGFAQGEVWDRRKDGSVYPKWLAVSAVRDDDGDVVRLVGSFTDISERKAADERIHHLAHHDALTDLPNRLALQVRLDQALASARREGDRLAVMFIDMDRFKVINDTLGHAFGDGLLRLVASRLLSSVRESDIVARLGGDEFVVVLPGVKVTENGARQAEKILTTLGETYLVDGQELHSTPSIGIAIFPNDGDNADDLMKNADTAMYHAKSGGRNNFQFFTAGMNAAATERLALEHNMRQGLARGEFLLHFQPQIEVASGRLIGFEALLRWRHPLLGLVLPAKFIPVAEDTGLIKPLGEWVLRDAMRQLRAWRDIGHKDVRMAVNLSGHQLRLAELPDLIADMLASLGLTPQDLELEIAESVAMQNPGANVGTFKSIRARGMEVSIDDFGTGYSSLSYLKQLPIQRLKLDGSFVRDIESDPNDASICAATIALAHSLGLEVVAEWVETKAQLDFLTQLGCDLAQGFYFGKPMPADEATAFLAKAVENFVPA